MQVKELDEIDLKQESTPKLEELEHSEENSNVIDSKLKSIVDVSGREFDFPLLEREENAVEELYVYKNALNLIPRSVGKYKGLRTLKFFANEVNLFPEEFKYLVDLEYLQVKVTVPGISGLELSKLGNLKELELSRVPQRSTAFPILTEISGLKCLTRLSVCHFSIRYLPPEIGCLTNLEFLDLSFNKMRTLPAEIASLKLLITLRVNNNKLIELPSQLSHLQKLEDLDLSNNRLTSLGNLELESMHSLHSLNIQHNKIGDCVIPSWICCYRNGNRKDLSYDEFTAMDVYEGVMEETPENSCSSSISSSSHLSTPLPNNQRLATRPTKGWKRGYNLQMKARKNRLNNCKKCKVDGTSRRESEKCRNCKITDDTSSECVSIVADFEVDDKDSFTEGEVVSENSHTCHENSDFSTTKDKDSSCEASSCAPNLKRHSDKDLDSPKPMKFMRPTNDPSQMSSQYSERSFCGVEDYLPDGFYDAGRERPFMPLKTYEKNLPINSREVIIVDRERDEELEAILLRARALVYNFKQMQFPADLAADNLQTASLLSLFVSDHYGGSDKSGVIQKARKAVSGSNYRKPFVCTCDIGIKDTNVEDLNFLDLCEKSLRSAKERQKSVVVPIGGLQFGVCRHRAVLMKYLCDRMEPRIPCELVRGFLDFSPHAWNVIVIKRGESLVRMIVDACHPHHIREESDPEYFCRYIPLSRINAPLPADQESSPNCSFPSLSSSDEIAKLASTTLMRCDFGSLEAIVKVRTIETTGASLDEIRNFEFSCLGEVRMLSALNHSCIVDFYGHQISSKWAPSVDGNFEGRTLQSAILMEYFKGGSLKNYLEKLSEAGEKHVALDIALSVARDVSFALTELHSRQIIHRDVKSENVLIDLEKKRKDGSPTVKICDFDMAIPLHACMHTCCIAHVGIPPPVICVGTPRWMAPEVFRAMHEHNMYGLEVDIWSLGCLLLELLTLQVPYFGLPETEIHELLQAGERPRLTDELEALAELDIDLETESETLKFLSKLYHKCTEKNPTDRPSAENIYNLVLDHAASVTLLKD